jgi:alpha-ribazole phosphatase
VYLTAEGVAQAEQAAEALRDRPLDRIVVSQLPRTQQTAAIITRYHQVPGEVRPEVNDIRSGCEGRPVTEYQSAIPHDPVRARVNGGESLLEYTQSAVLCIRSRSHFAINGCPHMLVLP